MTKKKPHKKTKRKKLSVSQLENETLKLLQQNPKKRFNPKQIARKLGDANNKDSVLKALQKLAENGKASALEDFKFKFKQRAAFQPRKIYEGYVDITRSGSAYIECEGLQEDVFVSAQNLGPALHGDRVAVRLHSFRGRRRPEGEVIKVIERASENFVGTLHFRRNSALVIPNRPDILMDIAVDLKDTKNAEDGDRVVVKIVQWHKTAGSQPKGVVTAVLGVEGSDLEMKTILINNGFNLEFPPVVLEETEDLREDIPVQEINRRKDFREIPTFTIDPEDAKDFDDALSVRMLENGHLEVGIHIADVSHYLKTGSETDKEAFRRSTSVYLVDRVLPMLPERISNHLCSLIPNEDRLTFSAVFEFNQANKIINRWFGKSVIHSSRRFTYEEAQSILDQENGLFHQELNTLNQIAKKMRKNRFKNGAIDFDMEEVRFKLDDEGVPVEVCVKERKDSHMLIEEFMLLANREVAAYIHKKGDGHEIPFVYRIHDYPNPDKVFELARFAKEMGFVMKVNTPKEIASSFNKLIKAAEINSALKLLQPIAIRTMAKAEYSTDNIGHYGLAFDYYSHFTSPIRRFSDVLTHRILEANLGDSTLRVQKDQLEERCKHISLQERKAMNAERESIKYKQVEFMEKHTGEVFQGLISGIIDRGVFVELKGNKCEGMVGFETMRESFEVAADRLQAKGNRSGKRIKIGDNVKVRILSTNLERRQIEMELV